MRGMRTIITPNKGMITRKKKTNYAGKLEATCKSVHAIFIPKMVAEAHRNADSPTAIKNKYKSFFVCWSCCCRLYCFIVNRWYHITHDGFFSLRENHPVACMLAVCL